jgi:hypothetical protein
MRGDLVGGPGDALGRAAVRGVEGVEETPAARAAPWPSCGSDLGRGGAGSQ